MDALALLRGRALPRRTFYSYRQAIEELFNISIECDNRTFDYYIADSDEHSESVSDWLLNSVATSDVLSNSRDLAGRIFLENVPSARRHLGLFIGAMREHKRVRFTYNSFTRSRPTAGVVMEPYFLKIFKQRWYATGLIPAEGKVKTYALDRISDCVIQSTTFTPDPTFDAEAYFADSFGIVFSQSEPKRVALKVDRLQAKYLRALPCTTPKAKCSTTYTPSSTTVCASPPTLWRKYSPTAPASPSLSHRSFAT